MTITVPDSLASALQDQAKLRGVTPTALAAELLNVQIKKPDRPRLPHDELMRLLDLAASDAGVSLPAEALTSEGIYES